MGEIDLNNPILELTRGLKLRATTHADAQAYAEHGDNIKVARNMQTTWPHPYTEDKGHEWITSIRNQDNWYSVNHGCPDKDQVDKGQKLPMAWAITLDGQVIGAVGLHLFKTAEARTGIFGYWIGEKYWGQGIATEAIGAFVQWLWRTYPYLVRLEASVYGWNPASGRVLEKAGLVFEGRARAKASIFNQVTDLLTYAAVREGVQVTSEPPTAV